MSWSISGQISLIERIKFWNNDHRAPVITGMGVISALGFGKEVFWKKLLAGQSGIDFIKGFDASSFPCQMGAEIHDVPVKDYLSRSQIAYYSRSAQYAYIAHCLAKQDAKIDQFDLARTDVIIGAATNAFDHIDQEMMRNQVAHYGNFDPFGISKLNLNSAASVIASMENLKGHTAVVSTACISGLTALGMGMERIRHGLADTVIVGATDIGVSRFLLNLFCAANFLSLEKEDPSRAVCPFDVNRTHSVLGDGTCVLILESKKQAKTRGANIYAQLQAYAQEAESNQGAIRLDETGVAWARNIIMALKSYGGSLDLINAHATGDINLDLLEVNALGKSLNENSGQPWITSIKGATGSCLSAAGLFQVASTALSIKDQVIPPSVGLLHLDPKINLKVVKGNPQEVKVKNALVNSRGVGGMSAALVMSAA